MTTAAQILTAAFNKIGVYSPSTAQTSSGLISLNNLMSNLGAEFLYPSVIRENFDLTAGTAEYTIGSGGDFDTVRPIKLETAFLRDSDSYDWKLRIISAVEYNDVHDKTAETRPTELYYVPEVTLGKIFFNYEPDEVYTLYIDSWKNFTAFATTATSLTVPAEYEEFFVYNLAPSLAEDWDRTVKPSVYARAQETKDIISAVKASQHVIPESDLGFFNGYIYDIETDSWI